ncbi:MAG: septum site-determining protein MinC [Lachnospiraceae bacterium]|nr:septum site-determining protein MinC [Lachnospiraceae bacterium]MBO5145114.1 septum site-determining protein MinC [Lachnospiraceae bacterium]
MKNSVILKSFSGGISVILDSAISFDELLEDIAAKFREADTFFKNASVAVSLEGRELTEQQEREVLGAITQNSHLNVLCLMGKDEEKSLKFLGIQDNLKFQKDENCGQFYRGTLKDGASIETEHSIIILGDVCKGSCVYSGKDIVILGTLTGDAYAGAGGSCNHFVAALDMNPNALQIGDLVYHGQKQKTTRWGLKPKTVPKIAYTYNGEVQIAPITKELLDDFTL